MSFSTIRSFAERISRRFQGQTFPDGINQREPLARRYLRGRGVEIGALHKPLPVDPQTTTMQYVDYKTLEENRERYPELKDETIVNTDIVDDGFILAKIESNTFDFLVANHALEHSPDPLGTLDVWAGKIRPGGHLFVAIPLAERCYDNGRPITTLEHFRKDHEAFRSADIERIAEITTQHVAEFIKISDANIRKMNGMEPASDEQQAASVRSLTKGFAERLRRSPSYAGLIGTHVTEINRKYDIHYHTFSLESYTAMLRHFCKQGRHRLEVATINEALSECIAVIRTSDQPGIRT